MERRLAEAPAPETMVARIPEILTYLVHVDSLQAIGVLAILLSLVEWGGTIPGPSSSMANLGARALWLGYFCLVTHKASSGKLRLPVVSDFRDPLDGLIRPLLTVLLATVWFWGALLGMLVLTSEGDAFTGYFQAHPMLFLRHQGLAGNLLLVAGLIQVPVAMVGVLVEPGVSLPRCLDPLLGLRRIGHVPRAFAIMYQLLMLLSLVGFALEAVGGHVVEVLPIPLVGPVIRHLMRLWVPLAQARLLGGFVFHNRQFMQGPRDHV